MLYERGLHKRGWVFALDKVSSADWLVAGKLVMQQLALLPVATHQQTRTAHLAEAFKDWLKG